MALLLIGQLNCCSKCLLWAVLHVISFFWVFYVSDIISECDMFGVIVEMVNTSTKVCPLKMFLYKVGPKSIRNFKWLPMILLFHMNTKVTTIFPFIHFIGTWSFNDIQYYLEKGNADVSSNICMSLSTTRSDKWHALLPLSSFVHIDVLWF